MFNSTSPVSPRSQSPVSPRPQIAQSQTTETVTPSTSLSHTSPQPIARSSPGLHSSSSLASKPLDVNEAREFMDSVSDSVPSEQIRKVAISIPPLNLTRIPRPMYIIGEGDLSYSAALAKKADLYQNTKVTTYDSSSDISSKYPERTVGRGTSALKLASADDNLAEIRHRDIEVAHGVDATDLERTSSPRLTERLVWNFPHDGSTQVTLDETTGRAIGAKGVMQRNQGLLQAFFESAHDKVTPDGTVEVTLKDSYANWNLAGLADAEGWKLKTSTPFVEPKGYHHVRTNPTGTKTTLVDGAATTYIFERKGPPPRHFRPIAPPPSPRSEE